MRPEPSGADDEADSEEDQRDHREAERLDVVRGVDVAEDRGQRSLLADQEEHDRRERADEPAQQAFDHERAAHEPVRRADELHHLDLASAREDRQPDRVRDQQHGCREQDDDGDEEDDLDHARDLEDPLRRSAGRPSRARRRRSFCSGSIADSCFTSSACVGVISYESGSGFDGRFAVSSGYRFCMRWSASARETNW